MTNHYLLRKSMVTHLPCIMVTHLLCMPSRKLLQIHLKGFVLKIGLTKPLLTWVATFKLLMILKYSDNDNSGEIYVGRIIKIGNLYNVGNRKTILIINLIERVDSILYLRFLECPNYPNRQRIYFWKVSCSL